MRPRVTQIVEFVPGNTAMHVGSAAAAIPREESTSRLAFLSTRIDSAVPAMSLASFVPRWINSETPMKAPRFILRPPSVREDGGRR